MKKSLLDLVGLIQHQPINKATTGWEGLNRLFLQQTMILTNDNPNKIFFVISRFKGKKRDYMKTSYIDGSSTNDVIEKLNLDEYMMNNKEMISYEIKQCI